MRIYPEVPFFVGVTFICFSDSSEFYIFHLTIGNQVHVIKMSESEGDICLLSHMT